jgi:hypothetical protein
MCPAPECDKDSPRLHPRGSTGRWGFRQQQFICFEECGDSSSVGVAAGERKTPSIPSPGLFEKPRFREPAKDVRDPGGGELILII